MTQCSPLHHVDLPDLNIHICKSEPTEPSRHQCMQFKPLRELHGRNNTNSPNPEKKSAPPFPPPEIKTENETPPEFFTDDLFKSHIPSQFFSSTQVTSVTAVTSRRQAAPAVQHTAVEVHRPSLPAYPLAPLQTRRPLPPQCH